MKFLTRYILNLDNIIQTKGQTPGIGVSNSGFDTCKQKSNWLSSDIPSRKAQECDTQASTLYKQVLCVQESKFQSSGMQGMSLYTQKNKVHIQKFWSSRTQNNANHTH
jgi:hypothetical protein